MTTYRVVWTPGTDNLRGHCHCGAERVTQDPVAVWDWLLGHPEDHEPVPLAVGPGRDSD